MDKTHIRDEIVKHFFLSLEKLIEKNIDNIFIENIKERKLSFNKTYYLMFSGKYYYYSAINHLTQYSRYVAEPLVLTQEDTTKFELLAKMNFEITTQKDILKNFITNLLNHCESIDDLFKLIPLKLTSLIFYSSPPLIRGMSNLASEYEKSALFEKQKTALDNFIKQKELNDFLLRNIK